MQTERLTDGLLHQQTKRDDPIIRLMALELAERRAADAAGGAGQAAQWISLADDIPHTPDSVLIRDEDAHVTTAYYRQGLWMFLDGKTVPTAMFPHWMPIPPLALGTPPAREAASPIAKLLKALGEIMEIADDHHDVQWANRIFEVAEAATKTARAAAAAVSPEVLREVREALAPFAAFFDAWVASGRTVPPSRPLGDELYQITVKDEDFIFRLSDCERASKALAALEGAVK